MASNLIVTRYIGPPIPDRQFDWCAYREDDEGNEHATCGYGPTKSQAIDDLLSLESDRSYGDAIRKELGLKE